MTWIKDLTLLILIIGALFGATLGKYPLHVPDGARYAEIPREMIVTHDYITPHLNGIKYFEKPPLFYWLQTIPLKVFGVNDFAASLVNAIFALGTCLLVYFLARKFFGRLSGWLAATALATNLLFFALTRVVTLDITLTFFMCATLGCFILAAQKMPGFGRNCYLYTAYAAAAASVLTKGLIGIILPGAIIFIWMLLFGELRNLKKYRLVSGIIIFLLIAAPWHIFVQIKNPEFFHFYFIEQHFMRYLTDYADRGATWWFFPVILIGGFFPWIVFFPQTIFNFMPRNFANWQEHRPTIFLLLWIIIIFTFYSFSDSKLIPYILPIFPPLAILAGSYLASNWNINRKPAFNWGFGAYFILSAALGICAIVATLTLNFAKQSITAQDLYEVGLIAILSGIAVLISYRRRGVASGLVALVLTTMLLLLSVSPSITISNNSSIKPIAIELKQKLHPGDEVICFANYYQDLPFYLERTVTVVDYSGELDFGMHHQNTSGWMIDRKTFWRRWESGKKIYLITGVDGYKFLQKENKRNNLFIIDKSLDTLLITNKAQ